MEDIEGPKNVQDALAQIDHNLPSKRFRFKSTKATVFHPIERDGRCQPVIVRADTEDGHYGGTVQGATVSYLALDFPPPVGLCLPTDGPTATGG